MEKEGLSRGTEFSSFNINTYINNDRHNQILSIKFLSLSIESTPVSSITMVVGIKHHYGGWQVSKGMNTDSAFQSYSIATYIRIKEEWRRKNGEAWQLYGL